MLIPQDTYEIIMYDHNAVPYMYLQRWDRLEYHQRVNAPWNSVITFRLGYNDPYVNDLMDVEEDHVIFIYRIDPITKNKERVYEGVHSTTTIQSGKMGQVIVNFYSQGFTALLARRVVVPPDGYESVSVSSNADLNMATLLVSAALGLDDPARVLTPMSSVMIFPEGHAYGDIVEYDARYVNLLTAFETLAEAGGVRFGVTCPTFLYDPTYLQVEARRLWGLDRRINSTQTEMKMFFNYESGNMEIPIYSKNYSEEKNVAYVGGQGVGANRRILQLIETTSTRHHWARKEAFTDARGGDNDQKLLTEGLSYLSKNMAKNTLTFNVRQVPGSLWPLNWGLGDVLTAKYRDTLFEKEIREVVVTVTGGSAAQQVELVAAEMEDVGGSLGDYLAIYTGSYYDPDPDYQSYPTYNFLAPGLDKIFLIHESGEVSVTSTFQTAAISGGPTYSVADMFLEGTVLDFVTDPYSPLYLESGTTVNGWAVTSERIYYIEDIANVVGRVVTSQYTFAVESDYRSIQTERGVQNWVIVSSYYPGTGVKAAYTTDGETWAEVVVSGDAFSASGTGPPAGTYDWSVVLDLRTGIPVGWTDEDSRWVAGVGITISGSRYMSAPQLHAPSASGTGQITYVAIRCPSWPVNPGGGGAGDREWLDRDEPGKGGWFDYDQRGQLWLESGDLSASPGMTYSPGAKFQFFQYQFDEEGAAGTFTYDYIIVAGTGTAPWTDLPDYDPAVSASVTPTVHVSGKTPGLAYVGAVNGGGGSLYKTTNYGASWYEVSLPASNFGESLGGAFHFPWHNNPSDLLYYWGKFDGANYYAYRTESDGTTATDITPAAGYGPADPKAWSTSATNRDISALMPYDGTNLAGYVSSDGGGNWSLIISPVERASGYNGVHVADDTAILYLWGPAGVAYSAASGLSIDDRIGNASTSETVMIGGW